MKIGIHCNQFDGRGSSKASFDYGVALQTILNHDPIFITSSQNKNEGLKNIQSRFNVVTYNMPPIHNQMPEQIIQNQIYIIKYYRQ